MTYWLLSTWFANQVCPAMRIGQDLASSISWGLKCLEKNNFFSWRWSNNSVKNIVTIKWSRLHTIREFKMFLWMNFMLCWQKNPKPEMNRHISQLYETPMCTWVQVQTGKCDVLHKLGTLQKSSHLEMTILPCITASTLPLGKYLSC